MKNKGTQFLAEAAVIGAIYVVLTLLFAPPFLSAHRSVLILH